MGARGVVGVVETWRTGAVLVLGSALVGIVVERLAGAPLGEDVGLLDFFGGGRLAFLGGSYALDSR